MIDLKLNPRTRDLVLPIVPVDGAERVAQAVGIRLRTWLGEWFLDTTHGVPYLENILIKSARPEIVEAILRSQILQVKGVKSIKSFTLNLDQRSRKASITFSAESNEGLISGSLTL